MIEIRDLHFRYAPSSPQVLHGIDLDIPDGQWVAIIGSNGSGKSTLARCLNGLLVPNSGSVTVDGLCTSDEEQMWQVRERVAFVFQNPDNQLVATSVEDDIAFGPENLGLPREEIVRRVDEALATMHLMHLRDKPPHLLSGGEKQRVAIAGALAMASRYLVLDEPTSMLDPLMREQVISSLQHLHAKLGMGILYVTNIMEEALLADRIIVLDKGQLVKDGTAQQVFSDTSWLSSHGLGMPSFCRIGSLLADEGYEQLCGIMNFDELLNRLCE